LYGLVQFVIPSLAPASFLILGGRFARASATFGKPNPFAGYLNMAWPLALALAVYFVSHWLQTRSRITQARYAKQTTPVTNTLGSPASPRFLFLGSWFLAFLFAAFALLLLAGLFASYSRGGWIGAIAGLGVLAIAGGRKTAAAAGFVVVLGLLIGLLGAFSALPPALTDRLSTISNNLRIFDAGEVAITGENFAIVERMAHWQAGWRMYANYPFVGVGAGNFNPAYPDFFVAPWSTSQGHAHNYYIHTLAESGIFGLLGYLLLVGAMLREALLIRRQQRGTAWGAAMIGVCGIIAAVAAHNIFENLHVLNLGIQLSSVWGLAIVAARWGEQDQT
jgi:O-antigen ligase